MYDTWNQYNVCCGLENHFIFIRWKIYEVMMRFEWNYFMMQEVMEMKILKDF